MREPAHRKHTGELRRATISLPWAALVTIHERLEAQSRKNGSDTVKQPCRIYFASVWRCGCKKTQPATKQNDKRTTEAARHRAIADRSPQASPDNEAGL